jgi:type IV secretory pathway TrbL component
MRRVLRQGVRTSAVVLASAALALAPGLAAAQSQNGSGQLSDTQVSDAAKQTGQGSAETSKPAGKTGQSAGDVGDRLHDSAKSFGEALLGGIKYAGRTVINFFNDDKPKR